MPCVSTTDLGGWLIGLITNQRQRCPHTCSMALGTPSTISLSNSDTLSPASAAALLLITGGSCLWSPTSTARRQPFMSGMRASGLQIQGKVQTQTGAAGCMSCVTGVRGVWTC
eukprot:GHUV01037239.1.p1 GENE.GHUV01037239.1~~GHUV01037239.1.p1  ORF type:complete len:113 (+),score=21.95 GHUV01037239.1:394-732(+)